MPIPIQNNMQYGGALINQKYAPIEVNIVALDATSQAQYTAFFQNRINLLNNQNLLPTQLNLYAQNWNLIQTNETAAGALPPIVVVSSNRADWILETYNTAQEIQQNNYLDVNDVAALVAGPTPWYDPKRINDPNRHVYILVHRLEYDYYQAILGATTMTVIGWSFSSDMNIMTSDGSIIANSLLGFGASRFAALEFCKYIFNTPIVAGAATPPVPAINQKAWLVDDNLVYVRSFPGFGAVEAAMNANNCWGLGFSGATQNSTNSAIMALTATAPAALGALQNTGVLQQCVLWNIGQLNIQHLNFSPYFLTSNEDTSFSNYLRNQAVNRLRICVGATVVKGMPTDGGGVGGAQYVSFLRELALQNFYTMEGANQVDPIPVIQRGVQNLDSYVTNFILPNAQPGIQNENPIYTQSKTVEQLMAKVVGDQINWVPAEVFQPNGAAAQPTQHF